MRLIGGVWNDEQGLLSRIIVAGGGGSIGTSSSSLIGLGVELLVVWVLLVELLVLAVLNMKVV
ncbi:hypothetical protein KK423_06160 [Clostridioides difficile]|nr:hypothetical protein [Clostridioides difficile]